MILLFSSGVYKVDQGSKLDAEFIFRTETEIFAVVCELFHADIPSSSSDTKMSIERSMIVTNSLH